MLAGCQSGLFPVLHGFGRAPPLLQPTPNASKVTLRQDGGGWPANPLALQDDPTLLLKYQLKTVTLMPTELNLSAETIRMFIQKIRAASNTLSDAYEDGHEGEVAYDAENLVAVHSHEGLAEEENDDLLDEEIRELLSDLNVDEAAELVALTWIGRGDYDKGDWDQALNEAKERSTGPTVTYLLGIPHLADYLETGLDEMNL